MSVNTCGFTDTVPRCGRSSNKTKDPAQDELNCNGRASDEKMRRSGVGYISADMDDSVDAAVEIDLGDGRTPEIIVLGPRPVYLGSRASDTASESDDASRSRFMFF